MTCLRCRFQGEWQDLCAKFMITGADQALQRRPERRHHSPRGFVSCPACPTCCSAWLRVEAHCSKGSGRPREPMGGDAPAREGREQQTSGWSTDPGVVVHMFPVWTPLAMPIHTHSPPPPSQAPHKQAIDGHATARSPIPHTCMRQRHDGVEPAAAAQRLTEGAQSRQLSAPRGAAPRVQPVHVHHQVRLVLAVRAAVAQQPGGTGGRWGWGEGRAWCGHHVQLQCHAEAATLPSSSPGEPTQGPPPKGPHLRICCTTRALSAAPEAATTMPGVSTISMSTPCALPCKPTMTTHACGAHGQHGQHQGIDATYMSSRGPALLEPSPA